MGLSPFFFFFMSCVVNPRNVRREAGKFSEEMIIGILSRAAQAGMPIKDIGRKSVTPHPIVTDSHGRDPLC